MDGMCLLHTPRLNLELICAFSTNFMATHGLPSLNVYCSLAWLEYLMGLVLCLDACFLCVYKVRDNLSMSYRMHRCSFFQLLHLLLSFFVCTKLQGDQDQSCFNNSILADSYIKPIYIIKSIQEGNNIFKTIQIWTLNNIYIIMKKVAYLYNDAITNYHFSKEHPMKTKRIKMTHSLIQSYNLCPYLNMFQSREASRPQLQSFHDPQYVKYLQTWVTGKKDQMNSLAKQEQKRKIREDPKLKALFKVNQSFDCPGFDGLYNFCQLAVGGSIDAADTIITGLSDIVINWSGGYHHAKKTQASGFCYVNDIVVCILQLLRMYPRVLYLDIDVHHGDGVQQAFYNTNRVMTVSFHEFDQDFFPGTGSLDSVGEGAGKYYSVNVPLRKGMRDLEYIIMFKKVMDKVMGSFRPDVCVIQCGADSLAKDRLGHQNLSIKGHADCVKHMMGYNTPIVFLGGGGYTIENVSRCWAYETSVILGQPIDEQKVPQKDQFINLYQHDQYKLHFDIQNRLNQNDTNYLDKIYQTIVQNMRQSQIRPSIAFHSAPKRFLPDQNLDWQAIDEQQNSDQDTLVQDLFSKRR